MRVTYQGSVPATPAESVLLSVARNGASIPVTRVTASPDITVGVRFYVTRVLRCTGVRFFWIVPTGTKDVKVSIWDSGGSRVATATMTVTGSAGAVNEAFFASPITLTAGALYRASAYQTDGTSYMKATISGVYDNYIPPRPFHAGAGVVFTACTSWVASDAHPTSTAASEGYAVEPILVV